MHLCLCGEASQATEAINSKNREEISSNLIRVYFISIRLIVFEQREMPKTTPRNSRVCKVIKLLSLSC